MYAKDCYQHKYWLYSWMYTCQELLYKQQAFLSLFFGPIKCPKICEKFFSLLANFCFHTFLYSSELGLEIDINMWTLFAVHLWKKEWEETMEAARKSIYRINGIVMMFISPFSFVMAEIFGGSLDIVLLRWDFLDFERFSRKTTLAKKLLEKFHQNLQMLSLKLKV